jgi:glycine reductase
MSSNHGKVPRRLTMASFRVEAVEWDRREQLAGRKLLLDRTVIERLASDPANFKSVSVDITQPQDQTRILNVLDAAEPMVKISGGSCAYPGVNGPALISGRGLTHRLEGFAVVSAGTFPNPPTGVKSTKCGFIDNSGAAAPYCDASETYNLVISAVPQTGISNQDFDSAMRSALQRVARHIAEYTRNLPPDEVQVYELTPVRDLPRVVYVLQLQDQGPLIRPLLYGHHLGEDFVATYMHPNEILDGAIVSANYRAQLKMSSHMHARNITLLELYRRHGVDLDFAGVIVKRGHHANHFLKERAAEYTANLAELLHADGAVVTSEGTGNTTIDFMQTIRSLENCHIPTAGVFHELGTPTGMNTPLVDSVEEANLLISSGNAEEPIRTTAPRRVLGGDIFKYYTQASADPYAALEVSALECFCGLARMAWMGFSAVDY